MSVGKAEKKIDSQAVLSGKPVYTEDLASQDALVIKLLRSPHAFAHIRHIDVEKARKLPGVEIVLTYEDVPQVRFTLAGQSYPEPSPYDRLILDRTVRYVGDEVAIVAAIDEATADMALRLIKVDYEILDPVLNFEEAEGHPSIVHDEEDIFFHLPVGVMGQDVKRNVVARLNDQFGGDFEAVYDACPIRLDETFYTQAQAQSMMETFRSYAYMDQWNRLTVISSTQVPFHIKRQLARALEISPSRVRVIKPRVGGGFGAKQTSETEIFAAIVTLRTGKPSKVVFSRKETFMATNTRHAMRLRIRLGAEEDGTIKAIHVDTLSDQGAYGVHAMTTVRLSAEKSVPLYNKLEAARFSATVVYTNKVQGGAFRGYGATQGAFAVESTVNILADRLGMDPCELRMRNIVQEGEKTLAYNKQIDSSALDRCIRRGQELFGWRPEERVYRMKNGNIRAQGMAITMQGSGIANIDTSTVQVKLNEEGDLTLLMSPTDVGTGTDTILVQMASEAMGVPMDQITAITADTDITPYDPGSYASSGAYVTGNALVKACENLKDLMLEEAAKTYDIPRDDLDFEDNFLVAGDRRISFRELASKLSVGPQGRTLIGTGSFGYHSSPPPYMAGFCEIELDPQTGKITVPRYVGIVDCGTVINPHLARVQAEGGIVQGMGLALSEEVVYGDKGQLFTNSFFQYNLPTRADVGEILVEFEESYEPSGPFGAKSIGEVVINGTAPAIASALAQINGKYLTRLPMTPERVLASLK